jgi:predicted GIY-YIG superfamily endonuclease
MKPTDRSKCAVYRVYDANDFLLYIGCSPSVLERVNQHIFKVWGHTISKINVEWFNSKEAASNAEKDAILNENPIWNIHYKRGSRLSCFGPYYPGYDPKNVKTWVCKATYDKGKKQDVWEIEA